MIKLLSFNPTPNYGAVIMVLFIFLGSSSIAAPFYPDIPNDNFQSELRYLFLLIGFMVMMIGVISPVYID